MSRNRSRIGRSQPAQWTMASAGLATTPHEQRARTNPISGALTGRVGSASAGSASSSRVSVRRQAGRSAVSPDPHEQKRPQSSEPPQGISPSVGPGRSRADQVRMIGGGLFSPAVGGDASVSTQSARRSAAQKKSSSDQTWLRSILSRNKPNSQRSSLPSGAAPDPAAAPGSPQSPVECACRDVTGSPVHCLAPKAPTPALFPSS